MHVCFHGGGGDSKIARSIRGLAKNIKAMSLNTKAGGCGSRARVRRRKADGLHQLQDYKDVAAGGAASASAKIAPAQPQEEADQDDHELQRQKDERGDERCGALQGYGGAADTTAESEEGCRAWVAEPEPGVLMTLVPRSDGTNRLRRLRFTEQLFDAWAAQSWWADNYDRVLELYSVVQSDGEEEEAAVPVTPCQSEEEEALTDGTTAGAESRSPSTSNFSGEPSSGSGSAGTMGSPILGLVTAPSTNSCKPMTTTARAAHNDDDQPAKMWSEWVEEYEAGVFITVRAYPDQPLQLCHVELSREKFGEVKARVWWQENKDRLRSLYSF